MPGVSGEVPSERRVEFESVLISTTQWAQNASDIRAMVLVGSWARGDPRVDSDIDLVVLCDRPDHYVARAAWVSEAAGEDARFIGTRQWGPLTEQRVALPSGLEVEFGFAPASWADTSALDPGTASVVSHGFRILYDPDGLLEQLAKVVLRGHQ